MASAMWLYFSMQEEDIIMHIDAKCNVFYTYDQLVEHCVT
jgi:hypothetical protein